MRAAPPLACIAVAALLTLSSGAVAQQFDPGAASLKLEDRMTMQQVMNAIGRRPDSAEQGTCGQGTPSPWPCRVWLFGRSPKQLIVRFESVNGVWVVNSWSVY